MKAPDFTLPDQDNKLHSLKDYQGKWRVVYFYPKDDTPGCTKEACNFRDYMSEFSKKGIHLFGISKDTVRSHSKFFTKYGLNFPLLSDPELATIKVYYAWGLKKFMGREFMGILRKTFVINPDGEIVKTYFGMDLEHQAQEILAFIELNK